MPAAAQPRHATNRTAVTTACSTLFSTAKLMAAATAVHPTTHALAESADNAPASVAAPAAPIPAAAQQRHATDGTAVTAACSTLLSTSKLVAAATAGDPTTHA